MNTDSNKELYVLVLTVQDGEYLPNSGSEVNGIYENEANARKKMLELSSELFYLFCKRYDVKLKNEIKVEDDIKTENDIKFDFSKNICINIGEGEDGEDGGETLNYEIQKDCINVYLNGIYNPNNYTGYELKITKCKIEK